MKNVNKKQNKLKIYINGNKLVDKEDIESMILGALGFSDKMIIKRTKLSNWRIHRNLRLVNVKRRDYRDGVSYVSKIVDKRMGLFAAKDVNSKLLEEKFHSVIDV